MQRACVSVSEPVYIGVLILPCLWLWPLGKHIHTGTHTLGRTKTTYTHCVASWRRPPSSCPSLWSSVFPSSILSSWRRLVHPRLVIAVLPLYMMALPSWCKSSCRLFTQVGKSTPCHWWILLPSTTVTDCPWRQAMRFPSLLTSFVLSPRGILGSTASTSASVRKFPMLMHNFWHSSSVPYGRHFTLLPVSSSCWQSNLRSHHLGWLCVIVSGWWTSIRSVNCKLSIILLSVQ